LAKQLKHAASNERTFAASFGLKPGRRFPIGAGGSVLSGDPGPVYAALSNAFRTRDPEIRTRYNMYVSAGTFYFQFYASMPFATTAERNQFLAGGSAWTTTGTSCGAYSCGSNVQANTEDPEVDVVFVESLGTDNSCGQNIWVGELGHVRDEILLMKQGFRAFCDDHRVETAYHEIGHLLGFVDVQPPPGTTIATSDLYHKERPLAPGPRPILGHHLRILIERYPFQ
jgi:hypothetical protein